MDFAENWSALLELFVSSAGLKLRMALVDTVLIKSGRVIGHFYTSRDGYVCRYSAHEITRNGVYARLAQLHNLDAQQNPFGYIAVAHYATGISRLLKRPELQELMTCICGPYEFSEGSPAAAKHEQLFCVQSYVVPRADLRYIAAYDVQEGPICTVLGRRFSARYTHAMDDPGTLVSEGLDDSDLPSPTSRLLRPTSSLGGLASAASAGGLSTAGSGNGRDGAGNGVLSAEELLVESQLVAMGLLEPRRPREGGEGGGEAEPEAPASPSGGAPDGITSSIPAPKRVKDDVAKLLQAVSSYVERAHGQRIVGLVAEFVLPAPPVATASIASGSGQAGPGSAGAPIALMAVHAVQLDARASRGRLGTFTERWNDYLEGMAPAPAPQAPGRRNQSPSILRSADASLVMTDRNSGLLVRTGPGSSAGSVAGDRSPLMSGGGYTPSMGARLGFGGGSMGGASSRVYGGGGASASAAPTTAMTRIYSANPSAAHHRAMAVLPPDSRPGSAPAEVVKVGRHGATNSAHASPANGHYTLRNAMSAARAGGGGNPTASPAAPDSYNLWLARDMGPTDSMAAKLALEVEVLRERLQRQTDIAVRAEAALQHLAVSSSREAGELREQIEELRIEVGRLAEAKRNLTSEYDRLRSERLGLQAGRSELSGEVEKLRADLQSERETLARAVRDGAGREEALQSELRAAREEREDALGQLDGLRRRLEEEGEVVEALRGQLYDYKQVTAQLQAQVRRGRNNKQMIQSIPGLPSTMPSVANFGSSMPPASGGGVGPGGGGGALRSTKDGDADSDVDTEAGVGPGGGGGGGGDGHGHAGGGAAGGGGAGGSPARKGAATGSSARSNPGGPGHYRFSGSGAGGGGRGAGPPKRASVNNAPAPRRHPATAPPSAGGARHDPSPSAASFIGGARPGSMAGTPSSGYGLGTANTTRDDSWAPNPHRASTLAGVAIDPRPASTPRLGYGAPTSSSAPRTVTLVDPSPAFATTATAASALTSLLGDVRRKKLGSDLSGTGLQRPDSAGLSVLIPATSIPGGVAPLSRPLSAATTFAGLDSPSTHRQLPPPSPTGSTGGGGFFPPAGSALVGSPSQGGGLGVGLRARRPNYDTIVAHDLVLMSWKRESLTPRMVDCHNAAIKAVADEETILAEIFNFYAQLGQVVWLDSRLTMNEKQFIKLALETGVGDIFVDEIKEVFRKLSDKTEFASEAASNHPHPYINFEQFPEAVMRLAALRYEWRPPENMEDAEEELYCASPPFMPPNPNPRGSLSGADEPEAPPRPPETVLLEMVRTYLKDDMLAKARRFKTAGSTRAKYRSQSRTAPKGLWVSSKSINAGV
ncbi:hypothetical protein HYH03_005977 [Edaphochlamys debaryana]|uniref:Uncharacterized protein n=1 Tax=Edaphochlamys debaryana TaxID=47281 RepID=A0A835Y7A0_9CHLO|nr:hypothetical protein HYH03_005977 [Edaphochlamys debaryana]|eukprot:KAG2496058.1 hypothetical protein HYH03_005977 [Edaphochlamys debaryana]